jgi:hypothetical protein
MSVSVIQTGVLTDDQIEALLQEAENRLKAASSTTQAVVPVEDDEHLSLSEKKPEFAKRKPIPRLQHDLKHPNAIQERDGVARIAPELLSTKQQALKLKSVEVKDKTQKDVSRDQPLPCSYMRKSIPIFLDADQYLVLRLPCLHESLSFLKIIVTLTIVPLLPYLMNSARGTH